MNGAGGWRYLLLFATGCVASALLPSLPGWIPATGVMLLGVAGLWFPPTRLAAAFVLGAGWFLVHAQWQLDIQWPPERAGEIVSVAGTIVELPEKRGQSVRFVFRPDRGQDGISSRANILVNWYRPREYAVPGARWEIPLRLRPPGGRDNPAGFDFHRYLLSRRIGAVATVAGEPEVVAPGSGKQRVDRVRQRLSEILQAETTHMDAAALKRALGIADRSGMVPELAETLRRTGTAHLLAISGLHIGMVAGLAGLLSGWLLSPLVLTSRRLDRRRLAIAGGLLAALAYAWLAGFTLPTQRALVMLAAAGLAFVFRRAVAPGHALLLALVAVLLFDPLSPLATGFWLSFAAVAVLIWTFAWRPGESEGRARWLFGLVRAQLIIAAGLLPLNIGLFQQLIPGALLANLVAIPMVGLWILPALLLEISGILAGIPTAMVAGIAETGLVVLLGFLGWIDQFALTHATFVGGGTMAVAAAMLGALWLLAPPGWPARWTGIVLMLPLLFPRVESADHDLLEAWMLDVGDGLAVVIRAGGETVLYDTGPGDGEGGDLIGRKLPALLARDHSRQFDRVVVSHAHRGHAGGLGSVRDRVDPERIHSSSPDVGLPCISGEEWRAGSYRFRFLHPGPGLPDLGRNSSCVLHVQGPGGSLLLPGGIDSAVEERLVRDHGGPPADVVVLPAGGHRRSASGEFLEAVTPAFALVSVRRHDRFDRPHAEVLARLEQAGIEPVSTGRCGAIRIRLGPDQEPDVRSMTTLAPRFWKPREDCP